jgi:hypothetical protein
MRETVQFTSQELFCLGALYDRPSFTPRSMKTVQNFLQYRPACNESKTVAAALKTLLADPRLSTAKVCFLIFIRF